MYKIKYPNNIAKFNDDYYNTLKNSINEETINTHLRNIRYKGNSLTLKTLITLPFEELLGIIFYFNDYDNIEDLKEIFAPLYDKYQPKIANFFMNNLELKSCFYCNIDFVNAFLDISKEYKDTLDFIYNAKEYELKHIEKLMIERIKGVGKKTARKKIDNRFNKEEFDFLKVPVQDFLDGNNYNHFTLDHVLPKSEYPFFSLCLYNFVPACYACNSKFKGTEEFDSISEDVKDVKYVIPSSKEFSLDKDFKFIVLYSKTKNIGAINNNTDFCLSYLIDKNEKVIEQYLEMFKIFGRYLFHKEEVLELIKKKVKYPESKINDISKILRISPVEIKKDIFGKELFDEKYINAPLSKYKRDIAKNIEIEGILD